MKVVGQTDGDPGSVLAALPAQRWASAPRLPRRQLDAVGYRRRQPIDVTVGQRSAAPGSQPLWHSITRS
jgi:hypothetical protein